jgi:hypothetical protein
MRLLRWENLSTEETLNRLYRTRLRGFDQPLIYENATLAVLPPLSPEQLTPTQRYILTPDLNQVLGLAALFDNCGVDIFSLTGALFFWIDRSDGEEEGPIPLTPPIIEESVEPNGRTVWLINDGMHRVAAARKLGRNISIVLARGVPREYPYYAFPLDDGWETVVELPELPDGFQKKAYRFPDNYKSLFRDFNAVFPGVQKQRKQSNPEFIKE